MSADRRSTYSAAVFRGRVDRGSRSGYRFAIRHGVAELTTAYMKLLVQDGKWRKDAGIACTRSLTTVAAWWEARSSGYPIECRNGWQDQAFSPLKASTRANGYWTSREDHVTAQQFKTTAKPMPTVYNSLQRWLKRITHASCQAEICHLLPGQH